MTPYDLSDIKIVRKKIGLTQSELAHKSSVSQSLIAKIEAGTLDPTYSNALKIFETLNSLQKKESLKAKDFIHSGLVSCQKDDFVRDVIKKMKKYEISQLPVMENCGVSGVVSETEIISRLLVKPDKNLRVKEVMGDAPPIVSMNTDEKVLSNLLRFFPLVIVQDKGKVKGIITRSDILRKVYG